MNKPPNAWRRPLLVTVLLLGVVVGVAVALVASRRLSAEPRGNVVLIVLDTVRADRMSLYGHSRETTPFLDEMRDELLVFEDVHSPAPWTIPSHASLFTGTWPATHRAQWGSMDLSEEYLTLAEIFEEEGFMTMGLSANLLLNGSEGMTQGFEVFRELRGGVHQRTTTLLGALDDLFDGASERGQGLFLFLNLMDAHIPYNSAEFGPSFGLEGRAPVVTAREKWAVSAGRRAFGEAARADHQAAYDAGVRYLDSALEEIFETLESRGILEETLVIITSDHGEGLGEHSEIGHSISIWEEQLRVPLIVRFPGGLRGGETERRAYSLTHLGGDILDWMEIPRRGAFTETPALEDEVEGPITAEVRDYFTELDKFENVNARRRYPELAARTHHRHVLYCEGSKLMVGSDGSRVLFDLEADPTEQTPRPAEAEGACSERYDRLVESGRFTPFAAAAAGAMDPEQLEALRQLGYVE